MLLYNLSFPNHDICEECELYLRGGELRDDGVYLKNGEFVTFDTYFNCFSHIRYNKYTTVRMVTLKLDLHGSAVVRLCLFDGDKTVELVKKAMCGSDEISIDIADLEDRGFIYFSLEAEGDCILRSGGWHCDSTPDKIKIGIVMCTFKREEYVKRNLGYLTSYMHASNNRFFDVYVVDNGQTLRNDFGEGVTVIPNENTGGSGGFTRGMKEVCENRKGEYTHFLLMDDDIKFDINTLVRTYSLLCVLKDEYKSASVGGAMLILDKPYLQRTFGDDWDGINIITHRKNADVRKPEEIALNETDAEPDYNAWFYMCMPTDTPEKYGYPLPFFIKYDDIEYGLRATEHIITTSGLAVLHEDFDVKYSPELEYYARRNMLITNSRFPRHKKAFASWKKLMFAVGKQLVWQRYVAIDLIFKACSDYFKGPEFFLSIDSAKKHKELRELSPKFLSAQELKDGFGIEVDCDKICLQSDREPKLGDIFALLGYLVPKCFYKKGITQVNMMNYAPHDYALKRSLLHFNPITGRGFITQIRKTPFIKSCFKIVGYFFKFMFCYTKTAKKYKALQ